MRRLEEEDITVWSTSLKALCMRYVCLVNFEELGRRRIFPRCLDLSLYTCVCMSSSSPPQLQLSLSLSLSLRTSSGLGGEPTACRPCVELPIANLLAAPQV
ncbi:hypothetical protein GOP47_0029608 [Adiantum capillus-veneris]|nr:hypothetical protein GOP47_0029608 [Adiantum capillus-veneris]